MGPRVVSLAIVVMATGLAWPRIARAGGFEYPGAGARSLGRGGANYAGVDDALAILYDPAELSGLQGMQTEVDLNWPLRALCYQRTPQDPSSGITYPEVCNDAIALPVPNFGATIRVSKALGIGFGVLTPASVSAERFGNPNGQLVDPNNAPATYPEPTIYDPSTGTYVASPARYLLVDRNLLLTWPSISIGFAPHPRFRMGLTFGWGIASLKFTTMTTGLGMDVPTQDIRSALSAKDWFVPRIIASVHAVPVDALDITAAFSWIDAVKAKGSLDLQLGPVVQPVAMTSKAKIDGVRIHAPQPWVLAFGIRYADRIESRHLDSETEPPRTGGAIKDHMATERWDIEADMTYEHTSSMRDITVKNPDGAMVGMLTVPTQVPGVLTLPHHWKDQVSVRFGTNLNVIPGVLTLRSGISFETNGIQKGYEQVDFRPAQRVGLHAGLTVRIHRTDVTAAYAHFFEKDVTVTTADASVPPTVGVTGLMADPINEGHYHGYWNVLAVGLGYHF